jgi:hypothetical protein
MDVTLARDPSDSAFAMGRFLALDPRSRERLHRRTLELAARAGRTPPDVAQSDYEQAKRELVGEWVESKSADGSHPASR